MIDSNTYQETADCLLKATRIAVVSHASPDSDAYGSQVALALALRSLGKEPVVINETEQSSRHSQLVLFNDWRTAPPECDYDLLVTCDCGDLHRVGKSLLAWVNQQKIIVNIDHHISNSMFGGYNLVVTQVSSTCEIVFELLKYLAVRLTPEIATCLYAGIAGDTGYFKYSSTSERTFHIAGELVAAGARPEYVAEVLTSNIPIGVLRLQGEVYDQLQFQHDGRCAVAVIDEQLFSRHQVDPEEMGDFVSSIRDIAGVVVAVLIRREGGLWKVSCRSSQPKYNVSQLASEFGGGGHVMAAGFRWSGDLDQLLERLNVLLVKVFS